MWDSRDKRPPGIVIPTYEEVMVFELGGLPTEIRNTNERPCANGTSRLESRVYDIDQKDLGEDEKSDQNFESVVVVAGSFGSHTNLLMDATGVDSNTILGHSVD